MNGDINHFFMPCYHMIMLPVTWPEAPMVEDDPSWSAQPLGNPSWTELHSSVESGGSPDDSEVVRKSCPTVVKTHQPVDLLENWLIKHGMDIWQTYETIYFANQKLELGQQMSKNYINLQEQGSTGLRCTWYMYIYIYGTLPQPTLLKGVLLSLSLFSWIIMKRIVMV